MRIKFNNVSITKRVLALFIINISIVLVIALNGYFFTDKNVENLRYIDEKALPVTFLHVENLYLLENIMNLFADTAVTNEEELLLKTVDMKIKLAENMKELAIYGVDISMMKESFDTYFDFTYKFTLGILRQNSEIKLEDARKLKIYYNDIHQILQKKKKNARNILSESLGKVSTSTAVFFKKSIIISTIGFFIMLFLGLYIYGLIKMRFHNILTSVENLTRKEPDFSMRLESTSYDEIGHLIELFNKLQDRLEVIYTTNSQSLLQEIEDTQREVVFTMGSIAESRSKETGNHVKRVAEYTYLLAKYYGLDEKESLMLKQASPMHDIGKVAIPDSVLNKPGRFNDKERAIMDKHAYLGYEMLQASSRPLLKMAATVAYEHHEKWDGSGYPNAKQGENIHIYGRITSLADVFDALGSDRVYKKAWDDERIFAYFKEEKAKHFDPQLIDIFFDNIDDFLKIRDTFID